MGELMKIGGPILWVIVAFGIVGFLVFVERSLHLHRARIKAEDFLTGILTVLGRGNVDEASMICRETPGPVPHIVVTAILHRHDRKDALKDAVEEAILGEISRMERRLVAISTIAQVSPLLGLLGTVLALVNFLLIMQQQAPLVQSADVMLAMTRALISTGAGLMVAIPAYVAFSLLVVRIDRLVLDMQRAGSEVVAFLLNPEEREDEDSE